MTRGRLFSWLDRVLRPRTTSAIQHLAEAASEVCERRERGDARFERQTQEYAEAIAEARELCGVGREDEQK